MILYIDKTEVPDLEDLSPSVLRYCIRKAEQARGRDGCRVQCRLHEQR